MDRRRFLQFLGAGVAGIALDQAIPLGRVWSFPKEIVIRDGLGPIRIGTTFRVRIPQRFIVKSHIFDFSHPPRYLYKTYVGGPLPENAELPILYSGGPPTLPPVAQLKSDRVPDFCPALGIPES